MNDQPNYASILDHSPDEVVRPKPLPIGTYLTTVVGVPQYGESSKKKTPYVRFTHAIIAAYDDVDAAELEEMGGFEGRTLNNDFYLTEDAVFRLDEFHQHCGIDIASDKSSRRQRNENCQNAQVAVVVKHDPSMDGTQVFARIARTAPAE